MSNEINFPKFMTPANRTNGGKAAVVLTQELVDEVAPLLTACDTQFQRVKLLYSKGWSVKQMQNVLFHANGEPMRPQMINQYISKIKAGN